MQHAVTIVGKSNGRLTIEYICKKWTGVANGK